MTVSLALMHHANQYLITDGYENREGISDIVGSESSHKGMLGVLAVHAELGVPANLHISGTLLEAIAWHCPSALQQMREYIRQGLIELIGSSYGQNIMRFFSPEYNRRQLNEQLRLYESLLGVAPSEVKIFWPPERVWETRRMAAFLRDASLLNGGYRSVILDDRTLLSPRDSDLSRAAYDESAPWTPELHQSHEIENGLGLVALPIGSSLRHSIPPKKEEDWNQMRTELESLLVHAGAAGEQNLLALYADDMEKVTGVWGDEGPPRYADLLKWIADSSWIQPVKLSDWLEVNPPADRRKVETGTFAELANEFHAGEGYENWFYSEEWGPYRECFELTERRVKECRALCGDAALIELAEKQLLLASWETAWHTPSTGAHGDATENGKPSPWARALTSHCRHALVTAQAACWMKTRDGQAHATSCDADLDGEIELIVKSDRLFGFVTPRWGGRLVLLFHLGAERGALVVGNPSDDWNFLEDLNRFMRTPRNHPGAFADVGFEEDRYSCEVLEEGDRASVRLINVQEGSAAKGLEKLYRFNAGDSHLTVRYTLPPTLKSISIECALSPDYLALLRRGREILRPVADEWAQGLEAEGVSIVLETNRNLKWEEPEQEWIGHGQTLRVGARSREFELGLRTLDRGVAKEAA